MWSDPFFCRRAVARLFRGEGFLPDIEKPPRLKTRATAGAFRTAQPRWVASGTFKHAADERNFGYSAAHEAIPVPLLPSGPGGVRGTSSHRARSSTHQQSCHSARTDTEV